MKIPLLPVFLAGIVFFAAAAAASGLSGDISLAIKNEDGSKPAQTKVELYDSAAIAGFLKGKASDAKEIVAYYQPLAASARKLCDRAEALAAKAGDIHFADGADAQKKKTYEDAQSMAEAAADECDRLTGLENYPMTPWWYLEGLPQPISSAKTDAKFKFTVADGDYVLVASNSRMVGKKVEIYLWMLPVHVGGNTLLHLSNDNTTAGSSRASLVHTLEDPMTSLSRMQGRDGAWLLDFVRRQKKR